MPEGNDQHGAREPATGSSQPEKPVARELGREIHGRYCADPGALRVSPNIGLGSEMLRFSANRSALSFEIQNRWGGKAAFPLARLVDHSLWADEPAGRHATYSRSPGMSGLSYVAAEGDHGTASHTVKSSPVILTPQRIAPQTNPQQRVLAAFATGSDVDALNAGGAAQAGLHWKQEAIGAAASVSALPELNQQTPAAPVTGAKEVGPPAATESGLASGPNTLAMGRPIISRALREARAQVQHVHAQSKSLGATAKTKSNVNVDVNPSHAPDLLTNAAAHPETSAQVGQSSASHPPVSSPITLISSPGTLHESSQQNATSPSPPAQLTHPAARTEPVDGETSQLSKQTAATKQLGATAPGEVGSGALVSARETRMGAPIVQRSFSQSSLRTAADVEVSRGGGASVEIGGGDSTGAVTVSQASSGNLPTMKQLEARATSEPVATVKASRAEATSLEKVHRQPAGSPSRGADLPGEVGSGALVSARETRMGAPIVQRSFSRSSLRTAADVEVSRGGGASVEIGGGDSTGAVTVSQASSGNLPTMKQLEAGATSKPVATVKASRAEATSLKKVHRQPSVRISEVAAAGSPSRGADLPGEVGSGALVSARETRMGAPIVQRSFSQSSLRTAADVEVSRGGGASVEIGGGDSTGAVTVSQASSGNLPTMKQLEAGATSKPVATVNASRAEATSLKKVHRQPSVRISEVAAAGSPSRGADLPGEVGSGALVSARETRMGAPIVQRSFSQSSLRTAADVEVSRGGGASVEIGGGDSTGAVTVSRASSSNLPTMKQLEARATSEPVATVNASRAEATSLEKVHRQPSERVSEVAAPGRTASADVGNSKSQASTASVDSTWHGVSTSRLVARPVPEFTSMLFRKYESYLPLLGIGRELAPPTSGIARGRVVQRAVAAADSNAIPDFRESYGHSLTHAQVGALTSATPVLRAAAENHGHDGTGEERPTSASQLRTMDDTTASFVTVARRLSFVQAGGGAALHIGSRRGFKSPTSGLLVGGVLHRQTALLEDRHRNNVGMNPAGDSSRFPHVLTAGPDSMAIDTPRFEAHTRRIREMGTEWTANSDPSRSMIQRHSFAAHVVHRQLALPSTTPSSFVEGAAEVAHPWSTSTVQRQADVPAPTANLPPGSYGMSPERLPERSAEVSRLPAGVNLDQLANRVYDLLVRRLASERQRRGA